MLLQDAREVEDSARLRSVLGSGSSNGSSGPRTPYRPAHSRMLETWILCELCNVGNMQDAVMLREHSVFFEGDMPQMVGAVCCRVPIEAHLLAFCQPAHSLFLVQSLSSQL